MLGDVVSTSSRFSYVTQEKKETLTANFRFNPGSPGEPDEPIVRHRVKVECSEGGNFSGTSGLVLTGNSVSLWASANSGYEFLGWYMNGEFSTALPNFTFTIGEPERFDASILEGYIPSFVVSSITKEASAYDFRNVDEMAADFVPTNPNAIQYVKAGSAYETAATGNVVVDGVCENLVLTDGFSFTAPEPFTATKAGYTRNALNDWGTICLPYAVESNEEIQFYQLKRVDNDAFIFGEAAGLAAGEPGVFVRLADGVVVLDAENTIVCTTIGEGSECDGITIEGSFDKTRVDVDDSVPSYYIKNNAFCRGTGYFSVPAFRAYFKSSVSNGIKVYRIMVEDGTTGIERAVGVMDMTDGLFYNLNGQVVENPMGRGVFLQNGKKYFINK